jgi:hypothetical protein
MTCFVLKMDKKPNIVDVGRDGRKEAFLTI